MSASAFARTPEPPYYAVIFTAQRTEGDRGYGQMAERMAAVAAEQPGFLGMESVRGADGFGITVSYWASEEAIAHWKAHCEHKGAQEAGHRVWYADYQLRIAKVERAYDRVSSSLGQSSARQIRIDDLRGPEIAGFLTEHLRSLSEISEPGSMHALDLDALRRPEITFWSVWEGGRIIGCGALKQLDPQQGEVKSMRTAATHLRTGVGRLVLERIVAEARERGYRRLSLETGAKSYFKPAHQLYSKFGFVLCAPFANYREDPNSLFLTLEL